MISENPKDRSVAEQIYLDLSIIYNKIIGKGVSVVVPAYNESKTIASIVSKIRSSRLVDEIIVVDDGSSDKTKELAEKSGAKVIRNTKNKGKGHAMHAGLKASSGEIILFMDSDVDEITRTKINSLIEPVLLGEADFTKATFIYKRPQKSLRYIDWDKKEGRVTKLAVRPLLKYLFPEITLQQPISGYYCAKREFFENIKFENDYGVDIGILIDAVRQNLRIKEVNIGKIRNPDRFVKSKHMSDNVIRTILAKSGIVTIK